MIDIKERIPKLLRDQVIAEFQARISEISQDDLDSFNKEVFKKIKLISKSHQAWVRDLALHIKILFSMLKLDEVKSFDNMEKYQLQIASAIQYFIDDFDLIPDHSLNDGFIDDALIVNLCIKSLPKAQRDRFEKYYSAAN